MTHGRGKKQERGEKQERGDKRGTHVGEEHAGDAAARVQALLVALGGVVAALQAALVARDRVLVGLDAAVAGLAEGAQLGAAVVGGGGARALLPADGQVRRGHDLDKVHVVEVGVVGLLRHAVERVDVVVGPRQRAVAQLACDGVGQLRAEAQRVNAGARRSASAGWACPSSS